MGLSVSSVSSPYWKQIASAKLTQNSLSIIMNLGNTKEFKFLKMTFKLKGTDAVYQSFCQFGMSGATAIYMYGVEYTGASVTNAGSNVAKTLDAGRSGDPFMYGVFETSNILGDNKSIMLKNVEAITNKQQFWFCDWSYGTDNPNVNEFRITDPGGYGFAAGSEVYVFGCKDFTR